MERTANFSISEKQLLIAAVERYKNVLESKETCASSIKKRNECWQTVCDEFNASTSQLPRAVKQIKTLYFNMKRKVKKDVAAEHKKDYLYAKKVAAEDKKEIAKTGGGSYHRQLDPTGAQLLAVVAEQIAPLPNPFDDASGYFGDAMEHDCIIQFEPSHSSAIGEPVPEPEPEPRSEPPIPAPRLPPNRNKTPNYKRLYFKKKYQIACFELKSKMILHKLEVKFKKTQLAKLNKE